MNAEALIKEIDAAFADVIWPYKTPPRTLTAEDTAALVEDLYLMSDEDKHYEISRAMCVAITQAKPLLRDQLLCRLVEFLDADFYDPEGINGPLKEAKLRAFACYSTAQSIAIWNWLTFIKVSYELRLCREALTSAIRFWGHKAQVVTKPRDVG